MKEVIWGILAFSLIILAMSLCWSFIWERITKERILNSYCNTTQYKSWYKTFQDDNWNVFYVCTKIINRKLETERIDFMNNN